MRLLAGLLIALVLSTGLLIAALALLHIDPGADRPTVDKVPELALPHLLDLDPAPLSDSSWSGIAEADHVRDAPRYTITGKTVPGHVVRLVSQNAGIPREDLVRNTVSGADGRFEFKNLRRGSYEVRAWIGTSFQQRPIDLTHDLDIELFDARLDKLRLTLTNDAVDPPAPLADAVVRLVAGDCVLGEGRSDASGVVELRSIPAVAAECLVFVGDRKLRQPVDLSKRPEQLTIGFGR